MNCAACGARARKTVAAVIVRGPGLAVPGDVCGDCASTGVLIVVGDDRATSEPETTEAAPKKKTSSRNPVLEKIGFGLREVAPKSPTTSSGFTLVRGELLILAHLKVNGASTRWQVSVATGFTQNTRNAYLKKLKARGLVENNGDVFVISDHGLDTLERSAFTEDVHRYGASLREWWLGRLVRGERMIVELLTQRSDVRVELSRNAVSDATGFTQNTRNAYLKNLAAKRLIEKHGSGFRIARELFCEQV